MTQSLTINQNDRSDTIDLSTPGVSYLLEILSDQLPYAPVSEDGVVLTDDLQAHARQYLWGMSLSFQMYRPGEREAYDIIARGMKARAAEIFASIHAAAMDYADAPQAPDAPFQTFRDRTNEYFTTPACDAQILKLASLAKFCHIDMEQLVEELKAQHA